MMSANLRAFLALIRHCEGTAGPDGYRTMFGGELFDSFTDHPRRLIQRQLRGAGRITSSAAGAYQFLSGTWDECRAALKLPDFSPESQDRAATFLVKRRGALDEVEAGKLAEAIALCAKEWASLPGSPYGQPTKSLDECMRVYRAAGGYLAGEISEPAEHEPAPIIDRSTRSLDALAEAMGNPSAVQESAGAPTFLVSPQPKPEPTMALPILGSIAVTLLPELIKRIPEFAAIFADRSRSSPEQYAEAASKAAEVVMGATKTDTIEGAIRKVDADPAALAAAREAAAASANEVLGMLLKANESDEKSREAAAARAAREKVDLGPWLARSQLILAGGFAAVTAAALLIGVGVNADKDVLLVIGTLFVNLAGAAWAKWGTIQDYRWGSSMGSAVKDEIIRGNK